MGNVALCAPSIISNGAVKVLSTEGKLLIYTKTPLKAAQIMLENPGQFLCESAHLKVGHRIPGICAEEELERGQLYFLLPMEVKVLSTEGKLLIYTKTPLKAAQIMLENPGQFLCESAHLKVGHRIPGICAEEELERGQLYFLLPMEVLYSVLTNEDLKCLSQKTCKGFKQVNFSKIFPEFCLFLNNSEAKTAKVEEGERLSRQRYWEPALETILETPPHG